MPVHTFFSRLREEKSKSNQRAIYTVGWPLKNHSQPPSFSDSFPYKSCTNQKLNSLASPEGRDAVWVYLGQWNVREDLLKRSGGKYSLSIKRRETHWIPLFLTLKMMVLRTWFLDLRQPFCYLEENRIADTLAYHPDLRKLMNHVQKHLTSDFWLLEQYVSLGFKLLLIGFLNICSLMHADVEQKSANITSSFPFFQCLGGT